MNKTFPTLPKTESTVHHLRLPFTKTEIVIRPYRVKEEKLLLQALTTDDESDIVRAVQQVVTNCIVSPQGFDLKSIPFFDFEYIFVKLRSISEVDTIEGVVKTNDASCNTDGRCGGKIPFKFGLEPKLEEMPEAPCRLSDAQDNGLFKLESDGIIWMVRYPSFETLCNYNLNNNIYSAMIDVIDSIIVGSEVLSFRNLSSEDIESWLEDQESKKLDVVNNFIRFSPTLVLKRQVKCKYCDYTTEIRLQGLESFFG